MILEQDPERSIPVFGEDHTTNWSVTAFEEKP